MFTKFAIFVHIICDFPGYTKDGNEKEVMPDGQRKIRFRFRFTGEVNEAEGKRTNKRRDFYVRYYPLSEKSE